MDFITALLLILFFYICFGIWGEISTFNNTFSKIKDELMKRNIEISKKAQ